MTKLNIIVGVMGFIIGWVSIDMYRDDPKPIPRQETYTNSFNNSFDEPIITHIIKANQNWTGFILISLTNINGVHSGSFITIELIEDKGKRTINVIKPSNTSYTKFDLTCYHTFLIKWERGLIANNDPKILDALQWHR